MIGDEETQKDLEDFLSSVKNKKKLKNDLLKAAAQLDEVLEKEQEDIIDTKSAAAVKPEVEMIKPRQRPVVPKVAAE